MAELKIEVDGTLEVGYGRPGAKSFNIKELVFPLLAGSFEVVGNEFVGGETCQDHTRSKFSAPVDPAQKQALKEALAKALKDLE